MHLLTVLRATCFDSLVMVNNLLFMAGYKAGRSAMENSAPDTIITTASSTLDRIAQDSTGEGTRHHQQCVGLGKEIARESRCAEERSVESRWMM